MYEEIIQRWKDANPDICHGLGLHEYDGILPDFTEEAISKRIKELKQDIISLQATNEPIEKMEIYEYTLLLSTLQRELFELDEVKEYLVSPLPYIGQYRSWVGSIGAIEMSYTLKNYASKEERTKAIIKLQKQIPDYLQNAETVLRAQKISFARVKIKSGINVVNGHISYMTDELISFVSQVKNDELIEIWSNVNETAITALNKFRLFLNEMLPKSHSDFALGEEKFLKILEVSEGIRISIDDLLKAGEKDLKINLTRLKKLAEENSNGDVNKLIDEANALYPVPEKMIEATEITLDRILEFLIQKDLVRIPTKEQCMVQFTPKTMRATTFAAMNTPGPFEPPEAKEAYYWITPPDPSWSKTKIAEYMEGFSYASLETTSIHEAWPGHYLQLIWANEATSEIGKMFAESYTMVEGWGLYCEEMLFEEGYRPPFSYVHYQVGQLQAALMRNVRFICAVNMHCKGMTVEEAKNLFLSRAFLKAPSAEMESFRGTVDPMYLNYTLGKLLIKKLRADYKDEKGNKFSLNEFHNTILSYGSPPIPILRKIMLQDSNIHHKYL